MKRIIPALLGFSFISWIVVQANKGSSNIFFDIVARLPWGDKIGHMLLFGMLSGLTIIAFHCRQLRINDYKIPIGAIVVLVFALIEEFSQIFFIQRAFELMDVGADILGIAISVVIFKAKLCKRYNFIKFR
jgi:VanZ family protein